MTNNVNKNNSDFEKQLTNIITEFVKLMNENKRYSEKSARNSRIIAPVKNLSNNKIDNELSEVVSNITSEFTKLLNKTKLLQKNSFSSSIIDTNKLLEELKLNLSDFSNALEIAKKIPKLGNKIGTEIIEELSIALKNLSSDQINFVLSLPELNMPEIKFNEDDFKNILNKQSLIQELILEKMDKVNFSNPLATNPLATNPLVSLIKDVDKIYFNEFINPPTSGITSATEKSIFLAISSVLLYAVNKQVKKNLENNQRAKEIGVNSENKRNDIFKLIQRYSELSEELKTNSGVKEEFIFIQDKLINILGLESQSVNELIEKYGSLDNAIKQVSSKKLYDIKADLLRANSTREKELIDIGKNNAYFFSIKDKDEWNFLNDLGKFNITVDSNANSLRLKTNGKTADEVITNYEELLEIREELINKFGQEIKTKDIFVTIDNAINELTPKVEAYKKNIDGINAISIQQFIDKDNLPKTLEELEEHRKKLIDLLKTKNLLVGTEEDIDRAYRKVLSIYLDLNSLPLNTAQIYDITQQKIKEADAALNKLSSEVEAASERFQGLEEIQEKLNNGYSFSNEEIERIKSAYPELESAIYSAADGWQIESLAIDNTKKSIFDLSATLEAAQIAMTDSMSENTKKRLNAIGIEVGAIETAAEAYAILAKLDKRYKGDPLSEEQAFINFKDDAVYKNYVSRIAKIHSIIENSGAKISGGNSSIGNFNGNSSNNSANRKANNYAKEKAKYNDWYKYFLEDKQQIIEQFKAENENLSKKFENSIEKGDINAIKEATEALKENSKIYKNTLSQTANELRKKLESEILPRLYEIAPQLKDKPIKEINSTLIEKIKQGMEDDEEFNSLISDVKNYYKYSGLKSGDGELGELYSSSIKKDIENQKKIFEAFISNDDFKISTLNGNKDFHAELKGLDSKLQKYKEMADYLRSYNFSDTSKEILELQEGYKNTYDTIFELKKKIFDESNQSKTDSIKNIDFEISFTKETDFNKRSKLISKQLKLQNDIVNNANKEIQNLKKSYDNGSISIGNYKDRLKELNELQQEGIKSIKEYYEKLKDNEVAKLDNQIDDINNRTKKQLNKKQKQIDALEKEKEKNENKKLNLETSHSAIIKLIDQQIEAIEKEKEKKSQAYDEEISKIEKANDERTKSIELMKLQEELAKAKGQKNSLIYHEDKGFVYEADPMSVKNAQDALNSYLIDNEFEKSKNSIEEQKQATLNSLQEQIDKWNEYKELWSDAISSYEECQNKITALNELGTEWESKILNRRIDIVKQFENKYNETCDTIENKINVQIKNLNIEKDTIEQNSNEQIQNIEAVKNAWDKCLDIEIPIKDYISNLDNLLVGEKENYQKRLDELLLFVNNYNSKISELKNGIDYSFNNDDGKSTVIKNMYIRSQKWKYANNEEKEKLHNDNNKDSQNIGAHYNNETYTWEDDNGNDIYLFLDESIKKEIDENIRNTYANKKNTNELNNNSSEISDNSNSQNNNSEKTEENSNSVDNNSISQDDNTVETSLNTLAQQESKISVDENTSVTKEAMETKKEETEKLIACGNSLSAKIDGMQKSLGGSEGKYTTTWNWSDGTSTVTDATYTENMAKAAAGKDKNVTLKSSVSQFTPSENKRQGSGSRGSSNEKSSLAASQTTGEIIINKDGSKTEIHYSTPIKSSTGKDKTGKYDKNTVPKTTTTTKSNKYSKGTTYAKEGLANVDENGEEIIVRKPVKGRMTFLEKGNGVINSKITKKLLELGLNPKQSIRNAFSDIDSLLSGINIISSNRNNIDNSVVIGDIHLHEIKNTDDFAKAIVQNLPSRMYQELLKR